MRLKTWAFEQRSSRSDLGNREDAGWFGHGMGSRDSDGQRSSPAYCLDLAACRSKEAELSIRIGDALHREVEIVLALLDADKVAAELGAGDTGRSAAHERIEYGFSGVGKLRDKIQQEVQRLLHRMLAVLDTLGPDGVVATAIPVLLTVAMKYGDGFPAHAGTISGELRSAVGLMPDAQADKR